LDEAITAKEENSSRISRRLVDDTTESQWRNGRLSCKNNYKSYLG
jgi:hypothetical protein